MVRLDGRSFTKFTAEHGFKKPNDDRGLGLMNACAKRVMDEYGDVVLAYGQSDEYSFVLKPSSTLYSRRAAKLQTSFASLFASSFVFFWKDFFGAEPLLRPPCFDGRVVSYPSLRNLRDYLSWRQADCHINNLYNTAYWSLVGQGMNKTEAEGLLKTTNSAGKNELLYSRFGVNYNTWQGAQGGG